MLQGAGGGEGAGNCEKNHLLALGEVSDGDFLHVALGVKEVELQVARELQKWGVENGGKRLDQRWDEEGNKKIASNSELARSTI